jgi:hypothetical protein
MPYYLVDLEAHILLTVEVEAEDEDGAQERALEMVETPGLTRLDCPDEAVMVTQVRDSSGQILRDFDYGPEEDDPEEIGEEKGENHDPGTKP